MTSQPPSLPRRPILTDHQRRQTAAAALRKIAPAELHVDAVRLRLDNRNTAGARRLAGYRELTVGRPFIDNADEHELDGAIAHELGHLLDPYLNLKLLPIAGILLAVAAFVLCAIGVFPVALWVAAQGVAVLSLVLFVAAFALFRGAEYRADAIGARLTSPNAIKKMLIAFPGIQQPQGWHGLLNTHPQPEARHARLTTAGDQRSPGSPQ